MSFVNSHDLILTCLVQTNYYCWLPQHEIKADLRGFVSLFNAAELLAAIGPSGWPPHWENTSVTWPTVSGSLNCFSSTVLNQALERLCPVPLDMIPTYKCSFKLFLVSLNSVNFCFKSASSCFKYLISSSLAFLLLALRMIPLSNCHLRFSIFFTQLSCLLLDVHGWSNKICLNISAEIFIWNSHQVCVKFLKLIHLFHSVDVRKKLATSNVFEKRHCLSYHLGHILMSSWNQGGIF